jgi:hypothetical protein
MDVIGGLKVVLNYVLQMDMKKNYASGEYLDLNVYFWYFLSYLKLNKYYK